MLSVKEVEVLADVFLSVDPISISRISRDIDCTHCYTVAIVKKFESLGILSSQVSGRCKLVSIRNQALAKACLDLRNECFKVKL